jgi:putative PEP-CTERM system histidine kinase
VNAALILWGHALAAFVFAALALTQLRRPRGFWPHRAFVAALLLTALWALAVAGIDARDVSTGLAESARNIAWLGFMLALVRRDRAGTPAIGAVYLVVMGVAAASVVLTLVALMTVDSDAVRAIESAGLVFRMMAAVSALVLVHHLHQAAPAARGGVRLVVLALAVLWGTDLLVFTTGYIQASWPQALVAARGFAMAGVGLILVIAAQRTADWTLSLSRPIAVRTLSTVVLILYAGITALATDLADSYAGPYARIIQTAIVFGATTALITLLSTPWLRAWTKVKLAKHLFRHRYDYRAEWQRFTATLGTPGEGADPLAQRIIKAVADLTDSPGGLLLVPENAGLGLGPAWNWPAPPATREPHELLARHLADGTRIVELDRVRAGQAPADESASVPGWLRDRMDAWAIVPLVHGGSVTGAIVLARPPVDRALDWEDFDLLRVAGRQAASYLAEDRAHSALADAARFDEFNRRFAFILHDVKNLVSQLTLVARNAERHADNPDFRADMIATLKDSSDRMTTLLARLSQHNGARDEPLQPVDVAALAERVAKSRRAQHGIVVTAVPALARCHAARLEQVLGHLVQNGIEASDTDAPVEIVVDTRDDQVVIDVIDHGCGMSPAFVRDQLFRPFVSTKPTGFGIGAFEARQLVDAMRGMLSVDSREGEGTRFRITVPAADAMEVAA